MASILDICVWAENGPSLEALMDIMFRKSEELFSVNTLEREEGREVPWLQHTLVHNVHTIQNIRAYICTHNIHGICIHKAHVFVSKQCTLCLYTPIAHDTLVYIWYMCSVHGNFIHSLHGISILTGVHGTCIVTVVMILVHTVYIVLVCTRSLHRTCICMLYMVLFTRSLSDMCIHGVHFTYVHIVYTVFVCIYSIHGTCFTWCTW